MRDRNTDPPINKFWLCLLPVVALGGLVLFFALLPYAWRREIADPITARAPEPGMAPAPATTASVAEPETDPETESDAEPAEIVVGRIIGELPVTMKVAQRTTTAVPGAEGQLSITVDDITRGQVMISLLDKHRKPVVGPASVRQDQEISFRLGESTYAARVLELSNALIGDGDFVTIVIDELAAKETSNQAESSGLAEHASARRPVRKELSERRKIELLIAAVEAQRNARFIRNGTGYSATEAADHLRMKLENLGDRIQTAADFIEKAASKSSVSGRDYLIELPDGRVLTVGQFLREELAKLQPAAGRAE